MKNLIFAGNEGCGGRSDDDSDEDDLDANIDVENMLGDHSSEQSARSGQRGDHRTGN